MICRSLAIVVCRVAFLLLLSQFPTSSGAQSYIGLREIINYGKLSYNAGSQSWDIRQDQQGRMYFANNEGLLVFDGIYWKLYPLPNKTIVRSIEFGKDSRIYIGGQDEIGYFSPNSSGRLEYTSLRDLLPETDKEFADIWDLVSYGNDVFFRSNNKIFRYSNNKITVYRPESAWLFTGTTEDRLIAQDQQRGIMVFSNDTWAPLISRDELPDDFDITDITCISKDSCLITSSRKGMFILSGNTLTPFELSGMKIDAYQTFSGSVKIDNEHVIVGTYNNGFYLIDRNGMVIENFSKKEGLQNSNVRSLFSDRNHNIWLGLDSGIDFIAFNNAIKHINPPIMNDGAGYAVAILDNDLYFGLSNGIYKLPLPDIKDLSYAVGNFSRVKEGQIWGLYVINNRLLAGTDAGFFEVRDNTTVPVEQNTGFWTFQPQQNLHQTSMIVAGNYHGVRLFEANGTTFSDKGHISNFSESSRFVVIDNNNTIWVSHPYRGIYRIHASGAGDNYAVKLYTAEKGLPSSLNNHVYKVKNRVVIATEKGIYEYNSRNDTFEPSSYFSGIFGDRSIRYLKEDPGGNIWFIQEKNIGVVDFSTLQPTIIYMPELKGKILSGFEHIYPINDNNIFVGGERGFYHINFENYKQNNHPLNVYIRTVKTIGKKDSILFGGYFGNVNEDKAQPGEDIPSISHQSNSFHFEFSSPLFEQQSNIEYSYYLKGFDKDWSEWSKKTEKDYTNLPAGNYVFEVKARNNLRNESVVSSYSFSVLPPWYQTAGAYVIYILLFLSLAYWMYRKQQKNLLRERQKHQEEQRRTAYLHQLELEKSEKEVVKLRNEKLESEIEFKNTELASTAMHLVQKEEFLLKIKEELQHLNKNGKEKSEPGELKKILRILSEEEKLNEEWEQFSVHFDKVHGDFLIKLKEKYPALKPHELKLCAYLRMNLSSKEIARLMSISVRGVEISRYRLRKKLQIPTEINLFQFLFDLQRNNFTT
jgi:ligand-binding sensor domain-containing protein/DNA-binding CsgD family transcriptional regulator